DITGVRTPEASTRGAGVEAPGRVARSVGKRLPIGAGREPQAISVEVRYGITPAMGPARPRAAALPAVIATAVSSPPTAAWPEGAPCPRGGRYEACPGHRRQLSESRRAQAT